MCNLNILVRTAPEIERSNIAAFLQSVTSHSFIHNNDGEGFYSNGKVVKGLSKINYFRYSNLLSDSQIIITHQRLSTSGFYARYTQPFTSAEFIIAHNGILYDFIKGEPSDTHNFFKTFLLRFEKDNFSSREQRIITIIRDILGNSEYLTSFSIILLDKITNILYYFKNSNTNIHFFKSKGILYITTNDENKHLLELLPNQVFKERKIADNTIYRITPKLKITPLAEIHCNSKTLWDYM